MRPARPGRHARLPPSINAETGAIEVGNGDQTMDTYIDFMCPVCNQFEQLYGEAIDDLVDDGTITLNIHPISILDRASQGTEYSTRAANAMYCVAAADADARCPSCRRCSRTSRRRARPG